MADLLNRPAFRNARRSAYDLMENDGLDPNQLGFVVSPDSGDIPIMLPTKSPNLRVLDYIKRGLDVELSQFKDGIGRIDTSNPKAGQLVDLISQFRNELTSASPKYREALARSGDYLSTSAAFNSASRLLSNGTNERDFAVRLNKMSPGERNGLVAGISDWAFNQAQTGKLTPDSIVGVRGQRLRDKLELALGKDNASRIIDTALGEARKMEFENRYGFVNSPSADLIAAGQEDLWADAHVAHRNDAQAHSPRHRLRHFQVLAGSVCVPRRARRAAAYAGTEPRRLSGGEPDHRSAAHVPRRSLAQSVQARAAHCASATPTAIAIQMIQKAVSPIGSRIGFGRFRNSRIAESRCSGGTISQSSAMGLSSSSRNLSLRA